MNTMTGSAFLIAATLVFGCTTSHRNPLVGKWKPVDAGDFPTQLELFDDGRAIFTLTEGNWTILDDGRLQMCLKTTNDEEIIEVNFSFYNDKVTVTYSSNRVIGVAHEFIRVK